MPQRLLLFNHRRSQFDLQKQYTQLNKTMTIQMGRRKLTMILILTAVTLSTFHLMTLTNITTITIIIQRQMKSELLESGRNNSCSKQQGSSSTKTQVGLLQSLSAQSRNRNVDLHLLFLYGVFPYRKTCPQYRCSKNQNQKRLTMPLAWTTLLRGTSPSGTHS